MKKKLKVESLKLKGFRLTILALCSLFLVPIHAQEFLDYPLDTVNGEIVYRYQVERSIGLFRIGVNFNVSQNDIIRLNPQLKERGLHFGEMLLVPTGHKVGEAAQPAQPEQAVQPTPAAQPIQYAQPEPAVQPTQAVPSEPSVVPNEPVIINREQSIVLPDTACDGRQVVELALMLPFESQQTKRSGNAERMMEFYQGALLALRDKEQESVVYRLRVYDTERSERRVAALCDSTELDRVRAVIGLVYPIQIERMAAWCNAHQVPLILPFSDNIKLENNPQVLQFNSTETQKADSLCHWIAERDSALHCVAIDVREADLASSSRALRKALRQRKIACTTAPLRDLLNDSIDYALDSVRENLIILHSDKYQHVRILLPHLQQLETKGYKIRLVSQYSWQKEPIALPQIYACIFFRNTHEIYDAVWSHYFVGNHVSEAPRYDLLGYDLMRATIGWLHGEKEMHGLQSDICWKQTGENGGYQNAEVRIVEK